MTIARSTRIASRRFRLGGALLTLALATASALAQDVLPRPAEPFAGKIGTTYADSTAAFPAPVTAPAGAPNVVLVLTDDVGFGAASTFGGAIPTPHLDQLADEGLRFNRFHTTAMCKPPKRRMPATGSSAAMPAPSSAASGRANQGPATATPMSTAC